MAVVGAAIASAVTYISASFAAVAAGAATTAQLVTVIGVQVGVGLAASAAATAVMQPKTGHGGSPTDFKADPSAPISGVMGRFGVGGRQAHGNTWGKGNLFISFATVLSLGPIDSVQAFTANEQVVTFPGAQGLAANVEPYKDKMWMTYRLGLPSDAALGPPTGQGQGSPAMSEWTSAHRMPQFAHTFWTMRNNSKSAGYEGGVPKPQWTVRGMKVWDPRKDSTYPGGSGPQRRDDWRTWEWSENPQLHGLAWVRGHHKLNTDGTIDLTKRLAGIGAPDAAIDIAAFVAGANIADANGWKIAGEWTTQDDKWQTLAAMLQAGGAVPVNRGAHISCLTNTPLASIYHLTNEDLAGPVNLSVMTTRRDRINTIVPRYRSEPHFWEQRAAGPVTSAIYRSEDRNEPRTREVAYSFVAQAKQAAELAAYDVANARESLTGAMPCKPHLLGLRAGDAFTATVPEAGLSNQKFVVAKRVFDPSTCVVTLEVRSETDAKHAWALGQAANPAPSPSLTAVDPLPPIPVAEEWSITPSPPSAGGVQIPGLEIVGTPPDAVSEVLIEVSTTGTDPWNAIYKGTPPTGSIPAPGLLAGQFYYVRITYFNALGAASTPLVRGPFVAGDLVAGDTTHLKGEPVQDVLDSLAEANDAIFEAGTGLKARTETLYADINAASTGLKDRTNALWADVNTASTGIKARLNVVETNLTTLTSSTTSRLGTLEATINTPGTGLVSKIGALETATTNLETYKADASTVNSIVAEIAGARNGKSNLSAELSSMRTATSDGLAQKASASQVSVIEAKVASMQSVKLPSRPSVAADYTGNGFGTPETRPDWTAGTNVLVPSEGTVREFTGRQIVLSKGWLPVGTGRTFRVTLRTRVTVDAPGMVQNVGFASFNESGSATVNVLGFDQAQSVANGWVTRTLERTSAQLGGVWVRARADLNRHPVNGSAPSTSQLAVLTIEDVTEAVNIASRTAQLETATANLQTGKADASRAAALEATINTAGTGLVSKVGALETATSNLQTNKAEASAVNSISAEVSGARNGKANLSAELSSMRTATSDGLAQKASAAEFSALKARSAVLSNLIDNPSGAYGQRGWIKLGAGAGQGTSGQIGPYFEATSGNNWASDFRPYEANSLLSLGYNGTCDGVGGLHIQFLIGGVYTNRPVLMAPDQDWGARRETTSGTSMPESGQFRIVSYVGSGTLRFSNVMVNAGPVPVAFRDDYSARAVGAGLTTHSNAIADLQAGKADASRATALEATINTPGTGVTARLNNVESVSAEANGRAKAIQGLVLDVNGYISGHGSTNDGITSTHFVRTDVFGLIDPDGTTGTEFRDGCWYLNDAAESTRTRYGKAFGSTHKLVWWTGPSSVPEGSETKANAYVYISMNTTGGPRFGGSAVSSFDAEPSVSSAVGTRTSAGQVTTAVVTITPIGATGTVSYQWTQIGGNEEWTIVNSTTAATSFRVNVSSAGEVKRAQFACRVTDAGSGRVKTLIVGAAAIYNV